MKIYTNCKNCKRNIQIKSSSKTRPDLQMEKGDLFELRCSHCGNIQQTHVNDTKAEVDIKILLFGAVTGIVLTILLWNFYGAIGSVSLSVPFIIWQQQMNAVKIYNSFMIKRK